MPIAAISLVQAAAAPQRQPVLPAAAELPDAPKPVTPANAAVHIMKVPSSRVIEAFASLQRALGQQTRSDAQPAAPAPNVQRALTEPAPRPQIDVEA